MDQTPGLRGLLNMAALLACLLGLGCATPKLAPSSFLEDYDSLQYHKKHSLYYSDPSPAPAAKTHVFLVRCVHWRVADPAIKTDLAVELCKVFRARLRLRVLEQVKDKIIVVSEESELDPYQGMPGANAMVVDAAITDIAKGSGLCRYFVGFGLGRAAVTVEARASHGGANSGDVYQMACVARSHGNPHGGLNPRCISARYSLRLACDLAAQRIAKHLVERMDPPAEAWWESLADRP